MIRNYTITIRVEIAAANSFSIHHSQFPTAIARLSGDIHIDLPRDQSARNAVDTSISRIQSRLQSRNSQRRIVRIVSRTKSVTRRDHNLEILNIFDVTNLSHDFYTLLLRLFGQQKKLIKAI
jgi:hypothetical protein